MALRRIRGLARTGGVVLARTSGIVLARSSGIVLALAAAPAAADGTRGLTAGAAGVETTAARLALDLCLAADPVSPRACIGEAARSCGAARSPACLDAETAAWDLLAEDAADALSTGRQSDEGLLDEARDDLLAHRQASCAALAKGDPVAAAACRRDKAADRTIVFLMLLSLEGGAR
jgi:hypothetical protein